MPLDESFASFNPYYDPEKCGLEIVGELECGGSYEFDTLVVWRRTTTNRLYYATDSGCSCPTPFEGYGSLGSLTPIDDAWDAFEEAVNNHGSSRPEKDALIAKIRSANLSPVPVPGKTED